MRYGLFYLNCIFVRRIILLCEIKISIRCISFSIYQKNHFNFFCESMINKNYAIYINLGRDNLVAKLNYLVIILDFACKARGVSA